MVDLSARLRPAHLTPRARLGKALPSDPNENWLFQFGHELSLDLAIDVLSSVTEVDILIGIFAGGGFEVATWSNRCNDVRLSVRPGRNTFRIRFQQLRLLPGSYFLGMALVCDRDGFCYRRTCRACLLLSESKAGELC